MMETTSPTTAEPTTQIDLPTAVQRILAASPEPLTVPKIRAQLPSALRTSSPEEFGEFKAINFGTNGLELEYTWRGAVVRERFTITNSTLYALSLAPLLTAMFLWDAERTTEALPSQFPETFLEQRAL